MPDGAGGDAVARANQGVVWQLDVRECIPAPLWQQERDRVGAEGSAEQRPQHPVRTRIADEDAAEQRLCVVRDHELLVDAGDRVGVDDVERAGRGREGVTEACDVDPAELEFGRVVVAGEAGVAAEQSRRGDLGHGVAGGDQPNAAAVEARDLADREDAGVGGAASAIDDHTTALVHGDAGGGSELVAWPHPDGEDNNVSERVIALAKLKAHDVAGAIAVESSGD